MNNEILNHSTMFIKGKICSKKHNPQNGINSTIIPKIACSTSVSHDNPNDKSIINVDTTVDGKVYYWSP